MRTIEVNIYNIEELDEQSQMRAYYNWLENNDYAWDTENRKTLEEFENIFPIKVRNWEYGGYGGYYISFDFMADDEIADISGIRLMKYIYNNYFHDIFKGKYFSLWSKKEKNPYNPTMGKLKQRYSKVMFEDCCALTGYYLDNVILQPIYNFLKNPSEDITFYDLMEECLQEWVKACHRDFEHCTSFEYFKELSQDNGWEYYENGRFAS